MCSFGLDGIWSGIYGLCLFAYTQEEEIFFAIERTIGDSGTSHMEHVIELKQELVCSYA